MHDEGCIKFQLERCFRKENMNSDILQELNKYREKVKSKNWIGEYDNGICFGNISRRSEGNHFEISASATGVIHELSELDYSKVIEYDFVKNFVRCEGRKDASSESLTHAVIYENLPEVKAVIHIHDEDFWQKAKDKLPTTDESVSYGTPEMANEIERLIKEQTKFVPLVMGGHREGILAYGKSLAEAFKLITDFYEMNLDEIDLVKTEK